ncbi:MAG: YbjN domain-containing protein [Clostridia bacterium]|nr:YbjN domain-containing protein [Clostridia bacterium]
MKNEVIFRTEKTFDAICEALDERRWHYEKNRENYTLHCKANGDDLLMELNVSCDTDKQIAMILSHLPFRVAEEQREIMAMAISRVNYALGEGCFDYHYKTGAICFRMTSNYRGAVLSKNVFDRMIMMSFSTIDRYNDKLLLFALGKLTLKELSDFIDS